MRIGILLNNPNPTVGGSKSILQLIEAGLLETSLKSDTEIIIFRDSVDSNDSSFSKFEIYELPKGFHRRYLQIRVLLILIFRFITREIDVIDLNEVKQAHLNYYLNKFECDFFWSCEPLGAPVCKPFATTVWDLEYLTSPWFPEFRIANEWLRRERISQRVLRQASVIIVGTTIGRDQISSFYGVSSNRILVNPFPMTISEPNIFKVHRKNDSLIYPAQFWRHKNHVNLLKGLALAQESNPTRSFNLYLPGSDKGTKAQIQELARNLGISERVHILGFISDSDLYELYKSVQTLVFPSFLGPDNLPPLEALGMGCQAVVSDSPGAREQFGNLVRYFDPNSPIDISKAISEISFGKIDYLEVNEFAASRSPSIYVELVMQRIELILSQIQ
jgi:glycosyltransferase involved in cell wall biosynthesis